MERHLSPRHPVSSRLLMLRANRSGWIPDDIARTDAVQSAAAAAAEAVELAAEAQSRTSKFLDPSPEEPETRDDGSPLQIGDKYTNTVDQSEYIYRASGWASNESLLAVNELEAALHSDAGGEVVGHDGETVGQALDKPRHSLATLSCVSIKGRRM